MREYQVSYRGGRFVTRDNIIEILEELNFHPGAGEGGGFELDGITNWYLLTDQDEGVQLPDMDLLGTDACNWTTTYQPPTANTGESCVWRFTDFRYKDGSTQENPILHIYVGPELITKFTSGGGMGVEFAYALFDQDVTEVILSENNGDLPVSEAPNAVPQEGGEWTKSLDTLSYDADSYLWMSQRKISADGIPALWEKPIRLSGADGDPGKDAFDTEFIYHRSGRKPTLDDNTRLFNDNIRSQDDYCPNNSYWVWTDNPQGVDDDDPEHKYEWMAFRTKMDSSHDDYNPEHPEWVWSNWSSIRIWSAYGEKGMDGDGVQYIYNNKFVPTESVPKLAAPQGPIFIDRSGISHTWNGDVYYSTGSWYPKDWEDGIFDRWEGGNYNPQGEWIPGGSYNDQGQFVEGNWTDEPQGVGDFEIANPAFVEDEPVSETNPETITVTHPFEWVSTRKRIREVWGPFSEPTLWSTFSREHTVDINSEGFWVIDGVPTGHKAEGEDGKGIDLKGRVCFYGIQDKDTYVNAHELSPEEIAELTTLEKVEETFNLTEDNIGDCYVIEKGRGGRYAGHVFLFLGPDDETGWEAHWYDFGEFQGDGSYVHIAWATYIGTNEITGQLEQRGFAVVRLPDVEYNWMGICTDHDRDDPGSDRFTEYKWNYIRGKDGDNYEWVYVRTQKEITPIIKRQEDAHGNYIYDTYTNQDETPHQYQDDEYLPFVSNPIDVYEQVEGENVLKTAGCYPDNEGSGDVYQFYDDPKGVNNTYRYEWKSQRKRENGIWGDFGKVSLNAIYSNDGQGVIRSTVFKKSISKPQTPSPGEGSYTLPRPEGWSDGLPTEGTGSIWMTSRIFTSDQQPPQSNWSDPILFQDSETLDIEVSPQDKLASPLYPPIKYDEATAEHPCNSHNPEEQSGYDHSEDTPPGPKQLWFDPEQDAAYIAAHATEFNWMATRSRYIDPLDGVPKWRDWVIVLIKGETGANGKSFEHAYLAFPNTLGTPTLVSADTGINTAPITAAIDGQGPWNWSLTTAGITVNSGESLWMTERWIQDTSVGSWGSPVRISGNGTPGEDAEDIQFIYKRSSTLPNDPDGADKPLSPQAVHQSKLPVTWYGDVENAGTLPNEYIWKPIGWNTTANGSWDDGWSWNSSRGAWNNEGEWIPDEWTDSPQGVDETPAHKYEWMCQRIKPRTNDPEHTNWGDWSKVFVWSAYGDTGMDGDGIEYIYTRTSNPTKPKRPRITTTQGETDYDNGENWNGGVINVSQTSTPDWQPKEYPGNNFHGWLGGTYNPQGEWIPGGSYDNQGNFVEGDWTDEPQGIGTFPNPNYNSDDPNSGEQNITYYREYVSQRKRVNGEWGDFSDPIAWSIKPQHFHINENGEWEDEEGNTYGSAEGPQGQGIQLKGTVDVVKISDKIPYMNEQGLENTNGLKSLQEVNPRLDPDHYGNIQPGDCYVVRRNRYLYVCLHNNGNWNEDRQSLDTWEATLSSTNDDPNWESVGEFQGQPGEGSYMHIAWAASKDTNPVNYDGTNYTVQGNNINFDQYGNITLIKKFITKYEDKKPNTDYDWMGVCTDHDNDDPGSDFDLRLDNNNPYEEYSNYQTYAIANPNKFNWFKYKWNNVRGRDGDNYERVYVKSKGEGSGYIPELPTTYDGYNDPETGLPVTFQDPEYRPVVANYVEGENPSRFSHTRFTDDPTGVSEDYPYEWMCERRKKLNTTTHQVEWFPFSPPALWAKYSFDGQHGNSVQVAYAIAGGTLTISDKTGNLPVSSEVTWYNNTTGLTPGNNQYLWMSQRVGFTGNWGLWEDPIRLSGQDGQPGADGSDIEFIYKRCNSISEVTKPGHGPNTQGETYANDDFVPDGWTDNPQGVGIDSTSGEFYKYEMACQRTKDAGRNKSWSDSGNDWVGPFVWSAYGDTGMDGDGVEYVYYRWDGIEPLVTPSEPKLKRIAPGETAESIISWNKRVEKVPGTSNPVQWQPKAEDWDESVYGSFNSWDSNSGKFNDQGEWIPIAKKRNSEQQEIVITTGEHPNEEETYWTDDPQGVGKETAGSTTTYYICEWVSVRKRINGGDWSTFSPPKLWASFGSDVKIIGGDWYINGVYSGKAEGEDGKGVALKGTVDVLNRSDRQDYASANGIEDYTTVKALQDIQPTNSLGISSINIGDCYVVKQNRYLYTSKSWFNSTDTPDDRYWNSTNQTISNWWGTTENPGPGQNNWAEIGEFQGADGENSYMHIAWATDEAVKRADDGTILLVNPFIIQHEQLDRDTSYEWMGVCTSEEELDPPNDYDSKYNSSLAHDNGAYGEYESYEAYVKDHPLDYNWHLYKWNHVKGKDGSDYENDYIKTKTNTGTGPGVNQSAYQGTGGHDDPTKDEFYPQVLNYDNNPSDYSNPTFTDDPTGPTAIYPYEWVAERRKKLNPTTQSMEWGPFNSPATLWAMYAFEGMTAYLTKSSDSLTIDAANNPVGSLNSSRLYTEVKIYDPKANNGSGQYLTYTSLESNLDKNKFCITSATSTVSGECTVSKTTSGRVYISAISSSVLENKNKNSCSVSITAKVYGGKTFNFTYTVTFNRIPQTYLSYTLTNDSDTFTYRTRTKQYDGLPIETSLDVITTDGTITKLNDNTDLSIFDGYISSVTVKGKGDSNFLKYAKVTHLNGTALIGTNIQTVSSTNKTVTVESSELDDTVTHNTKTITIYTNDSYDQATGLALDVCSNGTITLKRTGDSESTDIDLADTSHDLDITCVAELGGATYSSLVKTFKLSERNDATLYKLILSGDSFVKKEDGSGYLPSENTFSVNVNIIDGTGSSIESPSTVSGSLGLIRDRVFVRYLYNRAATSPFGDASYLKSAKPDFDNDITSNFFTVLVVEYDSNNVPTTYHDTETVNIVPPGVSTAYLDINFDRIVVDCDNTGKIINNDQSFTIEAYLRWGNLTCTSFTTKTFSVSGIGYTSTNKNYSLSTVSVIDDSEDEEYGKVYATITFKKDKTLTSGYITVRLKGTFSNGLTKDLTRNIEIQANRTGATGPQGPHGNFKATAFTRTYDIISNLIPSGGDYDSRNYPDPTIVGSGNNAKTYTWHDGIPEGEETLWSTTGTFLGANYPSGPSSWSNPSIVQDSEIYDVEFAERQEGGSTPSIPVKYEEATAQNPCNSHVPKTTDPGYVEGTPTTAQIWYDPILDKTALSGISSNIYWKAERTVENGTKGNWIITQIKGESEPWVSVNKDRFTFTTDPTGKLSSVPDDSDKTLTIRLKLGNIVQQLTFVEIVFTAFSESSTTVRTYSTSATSSTYRLTITNDSETGDSYVSFVLPISSTTTVYAPQRNLEITAKTNIYEATKTVKVEFDRKNRSSFKSFVFKRFAVGATVESPSTGSTGGSYANNGLPNGSSGRDSGWSDGLPTDGGTDPIYMSSRTFYSDNSQSTSWSTPVRMSDTDIFDVEFSKNISQPNNPPENVSDRTNAGWYDPNRDTERDDWDQMRWMATRTKTGNSWGNWAINKIKGETGDTGTGISSITTWYKAFDTLDVVIPSAGNETDGWTEEGNLTGAGWVKNYIKPTKENPYLWKFIRTEYEHPDKVVHDGLEMIQVWSENMINPNLLEDTEFTDINHISAWTQAGKPFNNTYSGTITTGIESNAYNNKNSFYVNSSNCNVSIYMLQQYVTGKIVPSEWYTLSFWVKCSKSGSNTIHVSIKFGNPSTVLLDETSSLNYSNDTSSDQAYIQLKNISNSWSRRTITFKSSDPTSSNYYEYIQFMMLSTTGTSRRFDFCMPKLEIGKVATDYVASLVKDPYPRLTVWGTGKQYYRGNYGEPYLDAVTYGANWFRCRNTHISSDSNKPRVGQTTAYWEPAQNLDFIVTDLLLAETGYIKNLIVGGLRTGDIGTPHVSMQGSTIDFYGRAAFPNIRMKVDEDDMAYLEFYDKDQNFLYDLGPSGIRWRTLRVNASFPQVQNFVRVTTTTLDGSPSPDFLVGGDWDRNLYRFHAQRDDGIITGDTQYTNGNTSIAEQADGRYFTQRTFLTNDNTSINTSTLVNYLYRSITEPIDDLPADLGNNTSNTAIQNAINDWLESLVLFWSFPSDLIEDVNTSYTISNNNVTLRYPMKRQMYYYINNGHSNTIFAFLQNNVKFYILS